MNLFTPEIAEWTPPRTLPELGRYSELWVDFETTGTNKHQDRPVGLAVATPDDQEYYLPFGHRGGNLDEDLVRRWASRELRDKTLIGSWINFDAHMARNWGLPLETLGVTLRDIQHQACLLNERRRQSGLDLLGKELLGESKHALQFDPGRMRDVHSSLVGPYACQDVRLTRRIDLAQRPLIAREDLGRVLALEDSIIFAVVEMEANGCPIDLEKLERWRKEARQQLEQGLKELRNVAGFPVNPKSFPDMVRLFDKWQIAPPIDPLDHSVSFAAPLLQPLKGEHPGVALLLRVKLLIDLLSKFLDNYPKNVDAKGLLRYNLHQLRADDYGTVTGRFSSAGDDHGGVNIQQVYHPENQEKKFGRREFTIRELFVPRSGLWFSADAAQIEYRLFAGLAGNPEVLAAYARDPETDFHQIVTEIVRGTALPDATRKHIKNVNFAKVYGAGLTKIASMLGLGESAAKAFVDAYDQQFPEVADLINSVSRQIRTRAHNEGLGYVRTLLGRRRRYPGLERLHSGLNAHIQGTAADINKIVLRRVYDERKALEITMRMTVHDELDGDIPSKEHALKLRELMNEPPLPNLRVPIRWSTGIGPNWADVEDL